MFGLTLSRLVGSNSGVSLMCAPVRHASKKATGSKRNPRHSRGQGRGLKVQDGGNCKRSDVLATQIRPNWLAGMNVEMRPNLTLTALKEGRVMITCENPDLNMNHPISLKLYAGRSEHKFFKKFFHIIPIPQHVRFKLIAQV